MHPMPEQPIKWLLRSVKDYLTEDQHKELMVGFDRIKRIYGITSRLRQAQTTLKTFHRAQNAYIPDTEGVASLRHLYPGKAGSDRETREGVERTGVQR